VPFWSASIGGRRGEIAFDKKNDWLERRAHERNHHCELGRRLHVLGVPSMDPNLYDSKWEYAEVVHRHLVGDISTGVHMYIETTFMRQVTVDHDGLVHLVAWLAHDGFKIPVLFCCLDTKITTPVDNDPNTFRVTCMRCTMKDP